METRRTNKPIKVFRIGSISASVFENESKESGLYHKVSFARSYRSGEEIKTSTSFGVTDAAVVGSLAQQVVAYISALETKQRQTNAAKAKN